MYHDEHVLYKLKLKKLAGQGVDSDTIEFCTKMKVMFFLHKLLHQPTVKAWMCLNFRNGLILESLK